MYVGKCINYIQTSSHPLVSYLSDVELLPVIGKIHPSERYYAKQQADYIISQVCILFKEAYEAIILKLTGYALLEISHVCRKLCWTWQAQHGLF